MRIETSTSTRGYNLLREPIRNVMESSKTLDEAAGKLIDLLKQTREKNPSVPLSYVAGRVTSDGEKNISKNLQTLSVYVDSLITSGKFGNLIFSAAQVFNPPLFAKFDNAGARNDNYLNFWRRILRSRYLDNIFMTTNWETSKGASEEFLTAKQVGLNIFEVALSTHETELLILPPRISSPSRQSL